MTQTMTKPVGTFDHAPAVEQMQAIDLTLRCYFQTVDWLRARNLARWKREPWLR